MKSSSRQTEHDNRAGSKRRQRLSDWANEKVAQSGTNFHLGNKRCESREGELERKLQAALVSKENHSESESISFLALFSIEVNKQLEFTERVNGGRTKKSQAKYNVTNVL